MAINILHRNDLPLGGFAGLKEHRLVMSPKLFGQALNHGTWPGIGEFVYLSDARFNPKGETTMHDHKEIDVISVMIEGRIDHRGSLETGQGLEAGDVQVQRAGGEGFSHNEINPDDSSNRMIQLWVLPEQKGERAAYKLYKLHTGKVTRVYGGSNDQSDTLPSHTVIEIVSLNPSQEFVLEKPFLVYLTVGKGTANHLDLEEGALFKDEQLSFKAKSHVKLIVIYEI
jgi:redox-sensitive bicupin YhaK (pirin superfamily)